MPITDTLAARAGQAHRYGLEQVRRALRFSLARRDRGEPDLAMIGDLTYPGASGARPVRLFVPHGAADTGPATLFFHGGGFVISDIETHHTLCARLAHASGCRVLSAGYGLAPEHPFPSQIADAEAAFAWLLDKAATLGVDTTRLGVAGDSAGAYLAATLAAAHPGAIRAQALLYPLVQLDDATWSQTVLRDSRVVGRLAVAYINAQMAGVTAPSLLETVDARTPPTLMIGGTHLDPVHPDVERYAQALRTAGVPVELTVYPTQAHGFGNMTHVSPVAAQAIDTLGARLGEALRDGG